MGGKLSHSPRFFCMCVCVCTHAHTHTHSLKFLKICLNSTSYSYGTTFHVCVNIERSVFAQNFKEDRYSGKCPNICSMPPHPPAPQHRHRYMSAIGHKIQLCITCCDSHSKPSSCATGNLHSCTQHTCLSGKGKAILPFSRKKTKT